MRGRAGWPPASPISHPSRRPQWTLRNCRGPRLQSRFFRSAGRRRTVLRSAHKRNSSPRTSRLSSSRTPAIGYWKSGHKRRSPRLSTSFNEGSGTVTDTILFNGRITTLDPSNPTATAVAIDKGLLVAVYRWLGALGLGGFTLIATFVANRFWEIPQPHRFMVENAFCEHLGLVGT